MKKLTIIPITTNFQHKSFNQENRNLQIMQTTPQNINFKSIYNCQLQHPFTFNKITFKGTPWKIPVTAIYSGSDAIKAYDYLACGNYLDSHDDGFSPENRYIRANNLSFLNKIYKASDKKEFIDYFCKLTGFPNLTEVGTKMENEFVSAANKTTGMFHSKYGSAADVMMIGYDNECSVRKRKAFPGADLDKCFVIIRGTKDDQLNEQLTNEFKGGLWNMTDQRILSYNLGVSSVPIVYTMKQITQLIKTINEKTKNTIKLDKKILEKKLLKYDPEYLESAEYNRAVSTKFPMINRKKRNFLVPTQPTKNDIKNFAFFIEIMREGKILQQTAEYATNQAFEYIKQSDFYKYSNLCQTSSIKYAKSPHKKIVIKKDGGQTTKKEIIVPPTMKEKTKLTERVKIAKAFNTMTTDDKYRLICQIIHATCGDDVKGTKLYTNDVDMEDKLNPSFNFMVTGDENLYYTPSIQKDESKLTMIYGKKDEQKVPLYLGDFDSNNNILWVDTKDSIALEQVINNSDLIKRIPKYSKISKVQTTAKSDNIDSIQLDKKTSYGYNIYEYSLE